MIKPHIIDYKTCIWVWDERANHERNIVSKVHSDFSRLYLCHLWRDRKWDERRWSLFVAEWIVEERRGDCERKRDKLWKPIKSRKIANGLDVQNVQPQQHWHKATLNRASTEDVTAISKHHALLGKQCGRCVRVFLSWDICLASCNFMP